MNNRKLISERPRGLLRVSAGLVFAALLLVFLSGSFYVIDTGHVGVERTLGKVD